MIRQLPCFPSMNWAIAWAVERLLNNMNPYAANASEKVIKKGGAVFRTLENWSNQNELWSFVDWKSSSYIEFLRYFDRESKPAIFPLAVIVE